MFLGLWDDPLGDHKNLWENITLELLSEDSSEDKHVLPARLTSRSCPTSPVMVRSMRPAVEGDGAARVLLHCHKRKDTTGILTPRVCEKRTVRR